MKREITKPVYHGTQFSTALNSTEERDRLWNTLDVSPGSIAIPDDEARLLDLPPSARLPWDQSVGIYLLGAFHQVHCLVSLSARNWIFTVTDGLVRKIYIYT